MALARERNEHTIAQRASVVGRGYWSGRGVNVRFVPAIIGTGIQFVRTDLPGCPPIDATSENRSDQALRTVLQRGSARVEMIEHVMAALYAMEIDNCVVEVDGCELPGLDGSSAGYVDALRTAGLVMQAKKRRRIVIEQTIRVGTDQAWIEASPARDGKLTLEYRLDYGPDSPIRPQSHECTLSIDTFTREIAAARTFVTSDQAAALRASGLASHVTNRDLLVFGPTGPVDNLLRFPDECSRHKLLDLIGDLSIVGAGLVGRIVSHRGGHQLNGMMAEEICQQAASIPVGCRKAA